MKGVDGHCDVLPNVSVTSASLMSQWRLAPAEPKAVVSGPSFGVAEDGNKAPGGSEVPPPWRFGRRLSRR